MNNGAGCYKAFLMIVQNRAMAAKTFSAAFHDDAARSRLSLPPHIEAHWAARLLPDEIRQLPPRIVTGKGPPPFDAIIQFAGQDMQKIVDLAVASAHQLKAGLDPQRSAVVVGEEIELNTGEGPIFLVRPLRRLSGLSHQQFMARWVESHAGRGGAADGLRCRLNHVDEDRTRALSQRLGFASDPIDGVIEACFADIEEAARLLSREDTARVIDRENLFVDSGRSPFGFYRRIT